MDFTPNLNLPFLLPNQAQKHVTLNEALLALDAIVQIEVASRSLSTPPSSPANGRRYIPASNSIDAWSGLDGQLVCFQDGAWATHAPHVGWSAWVTDEAMFAVFDGIVWIDPLSDRAYSMIGINASADMVNRLALKSPASLFDHEGADHRLKINKAITTDTASLIFQNNYSARAEIGMIGEDDLSIKVSPDGTSFVSALSARASDGYIGMGTQSPISRLHVSQSNDARLTLETLNSGSGGGFDIINTGANQSWRVTGQADLFKLRDHTAGLNKLTLKAGVSGDVILENCGNFGVATSNPTATLHVDGTVRIGSYTIASLPSAGASGAGTIGFVTDAPGGAKLAYSDGTNWRAVNDASILV